MQENKVYILFEHPSGYKDDWSVIYGVFSSKEKAKKVQSEIYEEYANSLAKAKDSEFKDGMREALKKTKFEIIDEVVL